MTPNNLRQCNTGPWNFIKCSYCPFDGTKFPEVDGASLYCSECGAPRPQVLLPRHTGSRTQGTPPVLLMPRHSSCVLLNIDGVLTPVFWRKILWAPQPFPDNFTDRDKFLDYLMTNTASRVYNYYELCLQTTIIIQPICLVAIYISVWRGIHSAELLSYLGLMSINIALILLGYLTALWIEPAGQKVTQAIQRGLILFACLKAICPILQTLTATFSDDTVAMLSTIMFSVHLGAYDYTFVTRPTEKLSGGMALNAAMFGTVLLASRLSTTDDVFAFLCFGILIFSFSIVLRRKLYMKNSAIHDYVLTLALFCAAIISLKLVVVAMIVTTLFTASVVAIVFGGPLLFIWSQKFKNDLRGPWDLPQVQDYQ